LADSPQIMKAKTPSHIKGSALQAGPLMGRRHDLPSDRSAWAPRQIGINADVREIPRRQKEKDSPINELGESQVTTA
jgi:hypothetical protein